MAESFIIVGTQVFILFILIGLGFLATRNKLITKDGVSTMTEIMLYLVTPCVIINAFQKDFDRELFRGFLISFVSAVLAHVVAIVLAKLIIKDADENREKVLRFATIFSNCGFMSLPLLEALLGESGVFYGASYVAVFNIIAWSYGLKMMDGSQSKLSIKKLLFNPGVTSVIVGLALFFTSFHLPEIVMTPIKYLAALNTPVPMLIIGYYVAQLKLGEKKTSINEFIAIILRLVVTPMVVFGILYLCNIRGDLLVSCVLSCSAPVAATTTMFSIKFGRDAQLSAKLVAVTTLVSIVSMTLIVGFVQYIA